MLMKQAQVCRLVVLLKLCSLYKRYTNVNSMLIGEIQVCSHCSAPVILAFTILIVVCSHCCSTLVFIYLLFYFKL